MDLYWRKEVVDDFAGYAAARAARRDIARPRLKIARFAIQ